MLTGFRRRFVHHRTLGCRPAASLLPPRLFLANYAGLAHRRFPQIRASNGRSKEEDFALAPQYAAFASLPENGRLCRMPELRRAEAASPSLRILRLLRRARGDKGAIGDRLTDKAASRDRAR
jgi:hypothetical protein